MLRVKVQFKVATLALLLAGAAVGCGGTSATPVSGTRPGAVSSTTTPSSSATQALGTTRYTCPTKAVVVTKPEGWRMVDNFAGQQTWQATGSVTNPNTVDVRMVPDRTLALTEVVLQNGKRFQAYSDSFRSVLPSGDGLILPGRTIEVTVSLKLTRPTTITTTDVFAVFASLRGPSGATDIEPSLRECPIPVAGARPLAEAPFGPRLCGPGRINDRVTTAVIGAQAAGDEISCG